MDISKITDPEIKKHVEMLDGVNESLWEEREKIEKASGYEEYCAGREGARLTLFGWIEHLKFMYDKNKEKV